MVERCCKEPVKGEPVKGEPVKGEPVKGETETATWNRNRNDIGLRPKKTVDQNS